jgi:ABC-type dipeptide/oligopeptide/nickel transport system permease component
MGRYLLIRIASFFGVLLFVSFLAFILMHSVPGGPFDMMGGEKGVAIPPELLNSLNHLYGLDKPILMQYWIFLKNAVQLNFGYSFYWTTRTVTQILLEQWPYTIQLGLLTLVFGGALGLALGIVAAVRSNSWIDSAGTMITLFCIVMPTFVLAILLQVVFSVWLKWLPTGGWKEPKDWILPVVCNAMTPVAVLFFFVRSGMLDVMRSNYVRTARAKGLGQVKVMLVHVFRNALTPVITVGGPMIAGLITGSFFIESIFRIPGIGQYAVTAVQNRDYPMIMATTLMWTTLISVTYLLTDLAYALVDPRVTFIKEK